MHQVDIWNIIEAFRENALNTLDAYTDVKVKQITQFDWTWVRFVQSTKQIGDLLATIASTQFRFESLMTYKSILTWADSLKDDPVRSSEFSTQVRVICWAENVFVERTISF